MRKTEHYSLLRVPHSHVDKQPIPFLWSLSHIWFMPSFCTLATHAKTSSAAMVKRSPFPPSLVGEGNDRAQRMNRSRYFYLLQAKSGKTRLICDMKAANLSSLILYFDCLLADHHYFHPHCVTTCSYFIAVILSCWVSWGYFAVCVVALTIKNNEHGSAVSISINFRIWSHINTYLDVLSLPRWSTALD